MRILIRSFLPVVLTLGVSGILSSTYASLASGEKAMPREGEPVDVAPYGYPLPSEDGKACGVIWEDPRDIVKVVVAYGEDTPQSVIEQAKLQYWQSQWPHRRIPRDRESGAGGSGWLDIGDWYNGGWRDADVELAIIQPPRSLVAIGQPVASYTFRPINAKEFPDLRDFDAKYRTTLKLRLVFPEKTPEIKNLQAFSDSIWQREDVFIERDPEKLKEEAGLPEIEVFNGKTLPQTFMWLGFGEPTSAAANFKWRGVAIRVAYTKSHNVNSFDKTIVTIRDRNPNGSYSFAMDDIVRGEKIFIPDFGVLVK